VTSDSRVAPSKSCASPEIAYVPVGRYTRPVRFIRCWTVADRVKPTGRAIWNVPFRDGLRSVKSRLVCRYSLFE
jgi:hypothetical protein